MSTDIVMRQQELALNLERELSCAQDVVQRSYLERLESFELVRPAKEVTDIAGAISEFGSFFCLKRLVTNKDENFLDKLVTVANAVAPLGCTLATIVNSDGVEIHYYIGLVAKCARQDNLHDNALRVAGSNTFSNAIKGNFSGSVLQQLTSDEADELCKDLFQEGQSVASVSGIVSLRNADNRDAKAYVQGLENLTNSLKGKSYTILMIADSVASRQIREWRKGYEELYTQLSFFHEMSLTINESESYTLSAAQTLGITESISRGISQTQTQGTNQSHTRGDTLGGSAGVSAGVPFVASVNASVNYSRNKSDTEGSMQSYALGTSEQIGLTNSKTDTNTEGHGSDRGKSLQTSSQNRSIKSLLEKIDVYLERLEAADNFGAFQCAAYVLADGREDALSIAGLYNALMRGDESYMQSSHINVWSPVKKLKASDNAGIILQYLHSFTHPEFYMGGTRNDVRVHPASLVSGKELAVQFALPKKSVHGLTVLEMIPFGRNIPKVNGRNINLGRLYYMGDVESDNTAVPLNTDSLTAHTFITGSTGTGKSNAVYHILHELNRQGVPFMVIEPAKGEYKSVFGGRNDVEVYSTNRDHANLLQINPFAFPPEIHVLEHIDRLVEIFNACWPMYAAMPAILKDAVITAYQNTGWDTKRSRSAGGVFPTFKDVLRVLPGVIDESNYSQNTSSDYKGALVTRVKSMTTGLYEDILGGANIPDNALFEENTIIDLSRVGSTETKALFMGLLILKLQEHRMAGADGSDKELRHVTVLEEAHCLLRRTGTEQSQEGANLMGKSVEMLTNSIAEMRTYGEGFIIADQSPGLLDMAVIRNTNTKIFLRLPDESDRQLVGKSAGLDDEQIAELARLEQYIAVVSQNGWHEAVLCKVQEFTGEMKSGFSFHSEADTFGHFRTFIEFIIGHREKLELTNQEAEQLNRWQERLNVSKETRAMIQKAVSGEALKPALGRWLTYTFFGGKELTRFVPHDDSAKAIVKMDRAIADSLGYADGDPAVLSIRTALLQALRESNHVDEKIRWKIERIMERLVQNDGKRIL